MKKSLNNIPKEKLTLDEIEKLDAYIDSKNKQSAPVNQEQSNDNQSSFSHGLSSLGRGGLVGALNLGRGAANIGPRLVQALGFNPQSYQPISEEQFGINKILPQGRRGEVMSKIGEIGGGAVPLMALPIGGLGNLAKGGSKLLNLAKGYGKSAAGLEAISPLLSPDASLKESYQEGMAPSLIGASMGPIASLLKKGISGLFKGGATFTPEEVAKNVETSKEFGMQIPLGEMINSPNIKKHQGTALAHTFFSGMPQYLIRIGQNIGNKVKNTVSKLNVLEKPEIKMVEGKEGLEARAEEASTMAAKLSKKIQETFKKNKIKKYDLYENKSNARAREINGRAELTKTSKIAQETLNHINGDSFLKRQIPSKEIKNLEELASGDSRIGVIDNSKNYKTIPFEKINYYNNIFYDKASKYTEKKNSQLAGFYKRLGYALKEDENKSINEINDPELTRTHQEANSYYKNNIAPFMENNALYKHAIGKANKDQFVQDFVKAGAHEKPQLLSTVLKHLDEPHRKQLAHEVLTSKLKEIGGDIEYEPDRILNIYDKLGKQTKKLLFTAGERKELDNPLAVRKMIGTDIHQMISTKTGEMASKLIAPLLGGIGGYESSKKTGYDPLLSALSGAAIFSGYGKGATKYLTSPHAVKLQQKASLAKPQARTKEAEILIRTILGKNGTDKK